MRPIIIILLISVCMLSSFEVKAYAYEYDKEKVFFDINFGDSHPRLLNRASSIDLTVKQPAFYTHNSRKKTIGSIIDEYAKASLIPFAWSWAERLIIAPRNVKNVFTKPPSDYLHNITSWQGCKLDAAGCTNIRSPFTSFPLSDGDFFNTNYIQHPLAGMASYLYYKSEGFDNVSAAVGSIMQSVIFEYAIESWQQPPSLNDIIVTPALGVPLGMLAEASSNWLIKRDSQFLRALGYIVNPTKIFIPDGDIRWQRLGGFSFKFKFL